MDDKTKKWEYADFRIPDGVWEFIQPMLPPEPPKPQGGRPRKSDRQMAEAMLYLMVTGKPWNELPRCFGAPSTVHDRYQQWLEAGVFDRLWKNLHAMRSGEHPWKGEETDGADI